MVELKLKCGFLTTETYSLFTELFSDEKVPSSGHFRVGKELAHCVCRSFQKYLALWDRFTYDILCLNEVKPFLSQERVEVVI